MSFEAVFSYVCYAVSTNGITTGIVMNIMHPVAKLYITVSSFVCCSTIGMQTSQAATPGTAVLSIYPIFAAMNGIAIIPKVSLIALCRKLIADATGYPA